MANRQLLPAPSLRQAQDMPRRMISPESAALPQVTKVDGGLSLT
jgi:hypothetical protein